MFLKTVKLGFGLEELKLKKNFSYIFYESYHIGNVRGHLLKNQGRKFNPAALIGQS